MPERELLLDRAIPDLLSTANLSPKLSAEVHYLAGTTAVSSELLDDMTPGLRARQHLVAGEPSEARGVLEKAVEQRFTKQGLAAAVWTASRIGTPEILRHLGDELDLFDSDFVIDGEVPLGPRSMFTGLLAAASGHLAVAAEQLSDATRVGDQRAPVWGAIARIELGRVRWTMADLSGAEGAHQQARRTLLTARTFFVAGGFRHLGAVVQKLLVPPLPVDAGEPGLGHFRSEAGWRIGFGVQPPCQVRKSKGLVALQYLIGNSGRRVPVVELERVLGGEAPEPIDLALVERLIASGQQDRADVTDEVRRKLFDDRARSRVSKLLSRTLERLVEEHALVGQHLVDTIDTGFACRYNPQVP
ncbi:MAG: hypothetical protein ACC652_07345, partial [Acidimicrobiales bacterium]